MPTECPRWRLIEPHYLNVPTLPDGTRVEWEHRETSRENGRTVRKLFTVPMLLDPKDPTDYNHPNEIVVCHDVEGAHMVRGDYIFAGPPTPGMEPLNDEAEAITAQHRPRWEHPIDTLPANGGMNAAESAFFQNMMAAFAKASPPVADNSVVSREAYDELKERLARLEAALAATAPAADTATPRRL
jgi:hypothetical protein